MTTFLQILLYLVGIPITAYLIGRFAVDDPAHPSHVLRDLSWVIILCWPLLFLLIPAVGFAGMAWFTYKVGTKHQALGVGFSFKQLPAHQRSRSSRRRLRARIKASQERLARQPSVATVIKRTLIDNDPDPYRPEDVLSSD